MRNKLHRGRQTRNQAIQRLLEHARYEVLPTATTEEKVLALGAEGRRRSR